MSDTLDLPDYNEIKVGIAENHSNICKFNVEDDTYEMVIDNIVDLVLSATRPENRLRVPSILVQGADSTERRISVSSIRSDDSTSGYSTPTLGVRSGMPTYFNQDDKSLLSRDSLIPGSETTMRKPPFVILPYSENPSFVGREDVFEKVKRVMQSTTRGQKRVALYGLGGVG
jgi:hypothetical protein